MWKGPGEDPGGPEGGGAGNKGGASQQELQDLKDQYEQQQTLIAQLKEMLRKTDQPSINQEKVAEYANTLTKMNARAKRGQREGQASSKSDRPKSEKVMLLQQQLEQNRVKLAERSKNQKGMDEMVTQIRAQLDDSQHNLSFTQTPLNISLIEDRVDYTPHTNPQELYNILLNKDKRINELNGKITRLEANVIDLQENIKEKDSVIDARTKAITLMTENLTKKGKNTLDTLDDTKEQMRQMQEDFVRMEEAMKAENEKLRLQVIEKDDFIGKMSRDPSIISETDGCVQNTSFNLHMGEIDELKKKNHEYIIQLEELRKKNDDYVNELDELKQKNAEYINELQESRMKIEQLETSANDDRVKQLQSRIVELEESLSTESPQSTPRSKRSKKGKQQKQCDNVSTKITELETVIKERDLKIAELEASIKERLDEITDFKQTVEVLQKELSEKQTAIEQLQADSAKRIEEWQLRQNELQATIEKQTEAIDEQTEKLRGFDAAEIGDENPAVVKLRQQLEESNKNMIKAKAEHKSKVKELTKKINTFKKIGDVNAAVVRLEAENSKYAQKIAELEEEKGQLQLTMVESKESINLDEVKDLEERLKEYLEEIADKNARIATLEQTNEENETKITEFTEKLDELTNTQNAQIKSDLTSVQYEEQLEKLESEKKSILLEKDELLNENKNLSEKIETTRKEKQEISSRLENYMQENTELIDRLEKLSAEKVSSAESIEIVENLTQQEKLELEAYQNNKNNDNSELNESVSQLNEETSELLQKIELFTVERREVMEKMEALTSENNHLSLKLKEVENNRDALVETYEQLQTEKEELDLKMEKLENAGGGESQKLIDEQRKEIDELKTEVKTIDEYKNLIAIQKQEIQELRLKVMSDETKHNTNDAILIEELQLKNNEFEIRNLELEKKMGDFEDKLRSSIEEIEVYKSAIEDGKSELINSTNLIEDLREKLNEKSLEVEHYEDEINKLGTMVTELSASNETKADANIEELEVLKQSLTENMKIIEDYEVELNQNSSTIAEMNAKMKKLNDRIIQTEYLLEEKDAEINKIVQEKLSLEENNRVLKTEMDNKETNFKTSCEELKERCLRLQQQIENNTDSFAPLDVKVQDLEKKNKDQLEKMKKIAANLKKKTTEYKELDLKHKQLEVTCDDLKSKLQNMEILNRDLETSSQDLKSKCEDLEINNQDLQSKCRDLEVNCQNLNSEDSKFDIDLSNKYQQLVSTNQDLEVKLKNVEIAYNDLEVTCSNFGVMMQDFELEKSKLTEELKETVEKNKELEEKLLTEEKETERVKNDLQLKVKIVRKLQARLKEEKQKNAHAQTDEEKLQKRDVENESSERAELEEKKDTEEQSSVQEEVNVAGMQEMLKENLATIEKLSSELQIKEELIKQLKQDAEAGEEKLEGQKKTGSLRRKKRGKTPDKRQVLNVQASEDTSRKDEEKLNLEAKLKELEEKERDLENVKKQLEETKRAFEESERNLEEKHKDLLKNEKVLEEKETELKEQFVILEESRKKATALENTENQQLLDVQKELQDKNTLIKKLKIKLQEKIKTSGQEIQNLRSQIEESERKNTELTQNHLANTAQFEDLQNIIREYENQIARLTSDLEYLRSDANNSSNIELSRKDEIINELNGRLEAKEINFEALRMKINELEMYIESQDSELARLKEKNDKLEEGLLNVEQRRMSLENKTLILGKELEEKEENARNEDILEERLKMLAERDQAIENSLKETLTENQNLIQENQKLLGDLEAIQSELQAAEQKLLLSSQESVRVEGLENENSELVRSVNNAESELRKVMLELNHLKEQRERSEAELQEQLEQYNSERRDLMGRLELALEQVKEVTQLRDELRSENGDLSSKMDQQQSDFEEHLRKYHNLEVEYKEKMEVLENISRRCEELEERIQTQNDDTAHQEIQQKTISMQQSTQMENVADSNQQHPNSMEELSEKLNTMQFMLFNAEKEKETAMEQCNQLSVQLAQLVYEKLESQITVDQEESNSERPTVKVKRSDLSTLSSADTVIEEPVMIAKQTFVCYKGEGDKKDTLTESSDIFGESEGWGEETTEVMDEVKDNVRILEDKIRVLELERENHAEELKQAQIKSAKLIKKLKEFKLKNEQLTAKTKNDEFFDLNDAIVDELKEQITSLEKRVKEISSELEKEKLEKENLFKRNDVLTSANERMIEMKEKQDMEMLAWQQRNRDLNAKLEQLEWGDEKVVAEVKVKSTNDDNHQELLETIKELTLDNEELQAMLEEQRNLRLEAEKSKQALPENVKSIVEYNKIELEKSTLEENLKEKEMLIEELLRESEQLRNEIGNSELQTRLDETQRDYKALQEKLKETMQQLQVNYSEKTQLEATILEHNITIEGLNQQIAEISGDQFAQNLIETLQPELISKINFLQNELKQINAEKEEIQTQYQLQRSIIEESASAEKEKLAFERQIMEKEELIGQVEKYKTENQTLVETLEVLKTEMYTLKQELNEQQQKHFANEMFGVHQTNSDKPSGFSQFFGTQTQDQFVIEPTNDQNYEILKQHNATLAASVEQLKQELECIKREKAHLDELKLKEPEKQTGTVSQFFQDYTSGQDFELPSVNLQPSLFEISPQPIVSDEELRLENSQLYSNLERLKQNRDELLSALEELTLEKNNNVACIAQLKREQNDIMLYLEESNQQRNEIIASLKELNEEKNEIMASIENIKIERTQIQSTLEQVKLEKNSMNQKTKTEDVSKFFLSDSNEQTFFVDNSHQSNEELIQLRQHNDELQLKIQELQNEMLQLEQLNPERISVQQMQSELSKRELQAEEVVLESDAASKQLVDKSSTADLYNQQVCTNLQGSSMTEFFDKQTSEESEKSNFYNQATAADFFNQPQVEKTPADFFNQQDSFATHFQEDAQSNVFDVMPQKQMPVFGTKPENSTSEIENILKEKVALIHRLEAENLDLQQKLQTLENSLSAKEAEMGAAIQQLNQEWSVHVDQRGFDVAESWKLHVESRESEFAQLEQQLRNNIQELEERCNALSQENGDLRRNVDEEVKNELDKIAVLRKLVEEKEAEIVDLKSKYEEFEQMQVDISNYTRIISELNMKIQELEGREIKLLEEKQEYLSSHGDDKLRDQNEVLLLTTEELRKEKEMSEQLRTHVDELVNSVHALQNEKLALEQLTMQNQELIASEQVLRNSLEQLRLKNEEYAASVEQLQRENLLLEQNKVEMFNSDKSDLETLKLKIDSLENEKNLLESLNPERMAVNELKLQNDELAASLRELQSLTMGSATAEEKDRLINKLQIDLKERENDLQETRLYLDDLKNQHAQMTYQINNLQAAVGEKDLQLQEYQGRVNQLEQQLGDYVQQVNHYSTQLQENYLHSDNLRQKLESYKSVTAHVQDKDAEIISVKNLLEEKQREFSYEMERKTLELQSVINDQQQELEVIRRTLQDLEVNHVELLNTNKTIEEFYKKQINEIQENMRTEPPVDDHTEKILELEGIIRDDEKQLLDLKNIIEEQVLRIEELKNELYAKSNNYDALVAQLDLKSIPKPTTLVSTSEDEDLVEPVSRAKLDFALYMLHQRDVRCEELTMELMQLLEERDTLQLRLSNALREKEELRAATEKGEGEMVKKNLGVSSGAVPKSKAIILGATGTELAAEATESLSPGPPDGRLANKLSELKSVGYKKDKTIVDEQALRRIQQLSILQEHQDEVAKLPPEAAARLVDASYTLSRDVQSPSKVLLNWLWGTSTPKVNNV